MTVFCKYKSTKLKNGEKKWTSDYDKVLKLAHFLVRMVIYVHV